MTAKTDGNELVLGGVTRGASVGSALCSRSICSSASPMAGATLRDNPINAGRRWHMAAMKSSTVMGKPRSNSSACGT